MNFIKRVLGSSPQQELVSIPSGRLYLSRSQSSLKGHSECIFKDAVALIRRTATEFHYQIVVQRAFEEGEEQLEDDEDEESFDEYTFLIDRALHFRQSQSDEGLAIFAWKDLLGEPGDVYEFVCDESTDGNVIKSFFKTVLRCQYEREYLKSANSATDEELEQFIHTEKTQSPPLLSAYASPSRSVPSTPERRRTSLASVVTPATPVDASREVVPATPGVVTREMPSNYTVKAVLGSSQAELHLFDATTGMFNLQDESVTVTTKDLGEWQYWLEITTPARAWMGTLVTPQINPVFNYEHKSFIFNYYADDGSASSWLLRFANAEGLERFQETLMRALWESLNKQSWIKANLDERDYVMQAFNDMSIDEKDEEEEDEAEEDEFEDATDGVRRGAEAYDDEEEYDDELGDGQFQGEGKNSQLAVGYKHDRSFVVRGNKIGVFRHTDDNTLAFSTTIENLKAPDGKTFSPSKVMLHAEDSTMILQSPTKQNSLFNMDLEYGKIVDEWKIDDNVPITSFTPSKKFSQMTSEPTFVGISHNSLFRVDPRLSGSKLVGSEHQSYATKADFSAVATTDVGHLAVASAKGDIRLYDRLGIRAKTQLPALGEPIIGLDVSADGKWILATCKTYLLLIDATIKDGKNAGKLGFEKSFGKDTKPRPKCLQLSPEHVAQMQAETKQPLSFTQGHFNTGLNAKETTIVSSSGPYVITWSLKQIVKGDKISYTIKRYGDRVTADNFKFGSDSNVIVALPDDVGMVSKRSFRKPTRESIATPVKTFR